MMTIASALTAMNTDIVNARTAITNKGGTVTSGGGSSQLATDIATIPSGGSAPVITSLNVTPTTSAQTISAPSGTDGYSPVNVAAVTAAIDSNIKASNIKSGVSILGVTGTVTELNGETRTVSLTSSAGNTFTPSSGKNAITSITVTPNNQARSVTPSTSAQTLNVNSGYSGNGTISVSAVTASIDSNITAGNIKKDVQILGVTGSLQTSEILFDSTITDGKYDITDKIFTVKLPDNVTDLSTEAMSYAFDNWKSTLVIDFPELKNITGPRALQYSFQNSGLTTINMPKLESVKASNVFLYSFRSTLLTSVTFPMLKTLSGSNCVRQAFNNCKSLTTVNFPKLNNVSGSGCLSYCFNGCTQIQNVYFRALKTTSFGSNTNQFDSMMQNTMSSVKHRLHFPSNLSSTISGLTGYPTFGGYSSSVELVFDLPATS